MKNTKLKAKILITIPAYNEARSIEAVVQSIKSLTFTPDILLVNDGSTDNTNSIINRIGEIKVIEHCVNLGIGAAMQNGFVYAMRNAYDYALQFDGDGQHDAASIPVLLNQLTGAESPDVVIGSLFISGGQYKSYKSTAARRFVIRLLSAVIHFLTGLSISDVTSGFRGYNKKAIKFVAQHYPNDFPEPEALILFSKAGLYVKKISVCMYERRTGQ